MNDLLFNDKSLGGLIRAYPESIREEVDGWAENKVLAASETDLINFVVEKYTLHGPELRPREEWQLEGQDTKVDVSHDFRRGGYGRGRPLLVPGQRIIVRVPFNGDPDLFQFQPSSHDYSPPLAKVLSHESALELSCTAPQDEANAQGVQQRIDSVIVSVERYLEWVRQDCAGWNSELSRVATECIQVRKRRLLEQSSLLEQLGIPLKRHADSSNSISIPVNRRRRPKARVPATPSKGFQPEPAIVEDDYVYILGIISSMATSVERSPSTFARLPEEHIRNHILVSLNGHFEGGATGETFNSQGKTDILIRDKDENVFIAECKFWSGQAGLHEAIDQLLGYVTWRDTKTALIVFSKNKDFTGVLETIAECVPKHPNCKSPAKQFGETQFRYVFGQKNDEDRDVHLSVLVFNIPPLAQVHQPKT